MLLILLSMISIVAADITQEKYGTSINVLGQSGKVTLSRNEASITITMDAIREVDASGNIVGNKGQLKHSLQTFASQTFTFSDIVDTTYQNMSCSTFSFASQLDVGSIQVDTYLFNTSGDARTVNETWFIQEGDIKFNIQLDNWNFCTPCSDGTAAYVELDIELKGQTLKQSNKTIDLGGALVQLSDEVVVDGNPTRMSQGYPKQTQLGQKTVYTFRFPVFNTRVVYDPVVQFSSTSSDSSSLLPWFSLLGVLMFIGRF